MSFCVQIRVIEGKDRVIIKRLNTGKSTIYSNFEHRSAFGGALSSCSENIGSLYIQEVKFLTS